MSDIFNLNVNELTTVGSVGIGTSSPGAKLQVTASNSGASAVYNGTLIVEQGSAPSIQILSANSQVQTIKFGDPQDGDIGRIEYSHSEDSMRFATNNTDRMRITSAGSVGIGTDAPSASAILDAQSTTKGVRMPNMTTTEKNAISSPAAGLMVYDTTLAKLCVYTTAWETITST